MKHKGRVIGKVGIEGSYTVARRGRLCGCDIQVRLSDRNNMYTYKIVDVGFSILVIYSLHAVP